MNKKESTFLNKDNITAIIGILFFIGLVLMIRLSPNKSTNTNNHDNTNGGSVENNAGVNNNETVDVDVEKIMFNLLDNKNYHFIYNINDNGNVEIIEGKVNSNKTKFSITTNTKEEYAKILDAYLKYTDGKYIPINYEIKSYLKYINIDNIKEILSISLYEEKDNKLEYKIDVTDLLDQYTDITYNSFDEYKDDSIIITLDNNQIKNIKIDYSNFFTYINQQATTFKVSMEFGKFGTVGDLGI